jgi:S-layer protein
LTAPEVPADKQVDPDPGPTTPGETFPLTTGVDKGAAFTGGAGNDTFEADYDIAADVHTLGGLDDLDGGDGTDTLDITDQSSGGFTLAGATVENIENITIQGADSVTADVSGSTFTGVKSLASTKSTAATLTAGDTTDVNVSGASGDVTVTGGNNQTVSSGADVTLSEAVGDVNVSGITGKDATTEVDGGASQTIDATGDIILGDTTPTTGAIEVTHTSKDNDDYIMVDGGSTVNVTDTADQDAAKAAFIKVGDLNDDGVAADNSDVASDAVTVTQNLNSDGTAILTGGKINVVGGTTVDITVNADITAKAVDANSNLDIGIITVNAGDDTTAVTVTQNTSVDSFAEADTELVEGSTAITFKALSAGQALSIDGLSFHATTAMTAAEVAQAFANLDSEDTQAPGGPTANGYYSGALLTSGLTSGAATGATVSFSDGDQTAPTFTVDDFANIGALKMVGYKTSDNSEVNAIEPGTPVETAGTAFSAGDSSANAITNGAVYVAGNGATASVADVTLDGYLSAELGTVDSASSDVPDLDALTTLSLANSAGAAKVATASTALDLTVNNVNNAVNLDAATTPTIADLNLTATGKASAFALTAAKVTDLTINAAVDLDLSSSTMMSTALETVSVTGAGEVDLSDISTATGLNSFDASGNTGGVTATIDANSANVGDIEEYLFSAGDDAVTLADATVDGEVTLGAGDDVLTLASYVDGTFANAGADTTLTATLDGGAGTNTLQMSAGDAAAASGATTFETKISGFQKLEIGEAQVVVAGPADADVTVNLANMDDIDYVITNGTVALDGTTRTSANGALILNNLANNGTVELNGEGNVEVGVTDADTGTADSLNLVGNAAKGVVTAADVETVNIDAAAGDSTFVLTADSVETIVITGDEFVNLTDAADYASAALGDASSIVNTGNSLTMIDASAMTDGGIVAATSLAEQTIKGGAGADYLTADNGKAVIEGGEGDDFIYVTDGATSAVIDGGAGADTFDITGAALGVEAFATFNNVDAGDTFILKAASFSSEAVDMTLDDPSTSDWINAAFSQTNADESIWFQHNGNTYIAVNATGSDDAYDAADDVVVKLTGLVDLSEASFNSSSGTLEVA